MRCADTRAPESVLNSMIGNRYYAALPWREETRIGDEKKKKKKKEGWLDGPWLVFGLSSPPRFVIEGVSSRSENRKALLVSADLKMYPFLSSLSLVRSIFFFAAENCKRDIEFKFCLRFLLPPPLFFCPLVLFRGL